jgi:hypothetical protein
MPKFYFRRRRKSDVVKPLNRQIQIAERIDNEKEIQIKFGPRMRILLIYEYLKIHLKIKSTRYCGWLV